MFTLGIDTYEKGVVGNTAIVMGVVEICSMTIPPPLLKILGRRHCQEDMLWMRKSAKTIGRKQERHRV